MNAKGITPATRQRQETRGSERERELAKDSAARSQAEADWGLYKELLQ